MGESLAMPTDPHHTPTIIQPSTSQPQKTQKPRRSKRKDTMVPQPSGPTTNVADEAINEEMDDSLVRAATTPSSLEAEQDSCGGPRRQETMGDTIAQTRSKNVSKHYNDPLLVRGNTLRSGDDRLKLEELMALCTTLQSRVLALETTKTTQATKIASLKRRVKKLERRNKSRTYRLKRLYRFGSSRRVESFEDEGLGEEDASKQGRIANIDANEDIYLVNVQIDEDMFGVNDLDGDEVIVESIDVVKTAKETRSVVEEVIVVTIPVSAATTTTTTTIITDVEMTLAQALAELKSAKPKADKVVIQEPEQAEAEEEERLAREKAQQVEEVNIAWDDVQAKIDDDYQLAQRLQAQEQEELTDEEKARLFVQFLEQRRKHFAAKRAEEKRNRPPTRAQQRSIMCTYLKNMEGWKPKSLKNKSFANIQELFDKAMKRVNTFVDYRTELVEESSKKAEAEIAHESSLKRAGEELEQESSKKQKLEEDKESEELKQCLEIIPDDGDDVTIDATPLSTKSPTIVDYKIYKEGKKSYFQIIRADGNSQMYLTFGKMLKNFDREDLEVLWSIVKARFKKTEPVNYMDNFLLLNLKTMFEHHVEDNNMLFYLLVEKINDVKFKLIMRVKWNLNFLDWSRNNLRKAMYLNEGRIVGIKILLEVTAAKLTLLVYKLLLLVLKVNVKNLASSRNTTAAARDEKWVPSAERVNISSTNIRLETTVPQKEETFQVVIDIIKNSTQQEVYVNAKVFRIILDICPSVKGVDFTDVLDDDTALTFLIDLGYKGPLNRHTNLFVDHMHQPWRTLAAMINKFLFRKLANNDKLRKSRIDILWGMFNRENVDYPELIWENFAYQIDHRKEKRSRRENRPYPRFTKIIINHFLKQHKSLTNLNHKHYHTIKDDGIVSRLKFVRIGQDYQEYGLSILDVCNTPKMGRSEICFTEHYFIIPLLKS
ncbi:hypothetical protein Tco_0356265 [Tanacetum coccineum]